MVHVCATPANRQSLAARALCPPPTHPPHPPTHDTHARTHTSTTTVVSTAATVCHLLPQACGTLPRDELLRLLGSLERGCTHPLASAILGYAAAEVGAGLLLLLSRVLLLPLLLKLLAFEMQ